MINYFFVFFEIKKIKKKISNKGLTTAKHSVFKQFAEKLEAYDITPVQYEILCCLWEKGQQKPKEIADYLGINQTVYSRYETGKNDMKPHQIIALCEYYKVSADYVFGLPKGLPYGLSKTK